jgi:hypothetical protein
MVHKAKYDKDVAYENQPEQVKHREMRNRARAELTKKGVVSKGDNKDVDHRTSLDAGGSNTPGNLRVQNRSTNRAWRHGNTGGQTYTKKK